MDSAHQKRAKLLSRILSSIAKRLILDRRPFIASDLRLAALKTYTFDRNRKYK
jgi:hypothetical protein